MSDFIRIDNLLKTYTKNNEIIKALDIQELLIPQGGLFFIRGKSGAGKTTLLNIIGLLDSPSSGRILIDGREAINLKDDEKAKFRREYFGFIFQSSNLIPTLTVVENVMLSIWPSKSSDKQRIKEIDGILSRVGLLKRRNHLPSELSGGEQQRVAIARALMNSPKVILADEPIANLDPQTSKIIIDFFLEIVREDKATLVITGNEVLDLNNQAYREIRLQEGKLVNVVP
jgi:putative ABC transport system ATP-binding protein